MKNLAIIRTRKGYTRNDMADMLHVTYQTYSRYETGTREPNLDMLKRIAQILETDVDLLIGTRAIDSTFDIVVFRSHDVEDKPIVKIIRSEPKMNKRSREILEEYFSYVISNLDLNSDIKAKIEEMMKKEPVLN